MTQERQVFVETPARLEHPEMLDLSVIVLNYKTRNLTLTCLDTVYEFTRGLKFETILVDNASNDGIIEAATERFPKIFPVRNKVNLGFSGGNNAGIRVSRGRYVVLLNSDARLKENSFLKIVQYLDDYPLAGIATPKVVDEEGVIGAMRFKEDTPQDACLRILGLYDENRERERMGIEKIKEVESIGGPCFLIRRSLIESIGLLDENYFLYNEEDDFCRRALRHGSAVIYFPETSIVHLRGQTTHLSEIRRTVIIETYLSNLYFYRKHYSFGWNLLLRTLYRVTFALGLVSCAWRHLTGKAYEGADDSLTLKLKLLLMKTPPLQNSDFL